MFGYLWSHFLSAGTGRLQGQRAVHTGFRRSCSCTPADDGAQNRAAQVVMWLADSPFEVTGCQGLSAIHNSTVWRCIVSRVGWCVLTFIQWTVARGSGGDIVGTQYTRVCQANGGCGWWMRNIQQWMCYLSQTAGSASCSFQFPLVTSGSLL